MTVQLEPPEIAALRARTRASAPPRDQDVDPMTAFTERDLFALWRESGFLEIHLELRIDQQPREPWPWAAYFASSPNPNAPTIGEHLRTIFDDEQLAEYERHMKPLIEEGRLVEASAMAFLWAVKP